MTDRPRVLLVEDDPALRAFLADNLAADGFVTLLAETAGEGLRMLEYRRPDLALVDIGLPDGSGLDLIARVRAADGIGSRVDPATPLVVLTGLAGEIDRVRGFEKGADDYVVKPFSYGELRLRLLALLRRTRVQRNGPARLRVGGLEIDPVSRDVRLHGLPIVLSQKEFALLRALALDPTRVYTKHELLRDVWGFRSPGTTRTLDSHACRLRRKLGPEFVVNVWGQTVAKGPTRPQPVLTGSTLRTPHADHKPPPLPPHEARRLRTCLARRWPLRRLVHLPGRAAPPDRGVG
jgi:DNA-binding response OmpR family regulator